MDNSLEVITAAPQTGRTGSPESARGAGPATSWLDRSIVASLDWEKALYIALFVVALATRFWDLGARVMSHDESLHTFYSYNLAIGKGFQHTPLMHGPFLFHLTALSYFLFGADDYTSRVAIALFGAVLVVLPYFFRRYLGRAGALFTATAILISPSLLYHARYIRQEGTIVVWTVLTVLFVWRYMETRRFSWLVALSAVLALHGTDKSTSFFNVAVLVAFIAPLALLQLLSHRNSKGALAKAIGYGAVIAAFMVVYAIGFEIVSSKLLVPLLNPKPSVQTAGVVSLNIDFASGVYAVILIALGVGACAGLMWVIRRFFGGWLAEARERSTAFDIAVVLVTTTMFMASSAMLLVLNPVWRMLNSGQELIKISLLGDMGNFASNMGVITTMFALNVALIAVAAAVGLTWNWRRWLVIVALYVAITLTLFTTVLTNATGVGTGYVGQLGYWMAQQDVKRGSQPWYYYFIITPLYEYLVIAGAACATALIGAQWWRALRRRGQPELEEAAAGSAAGASALPQPAVRQAPVESETRVNIGPIELKFRTRKSPKSSTAAPAAPLDWARLIEPGKVFPLFLVWWMLSTFTIYTLAGEKMPWLTTHIALPMCFLTGYFLNWLVTGARWRTVRSRNLWMLAGLAVLAVIMFVRALSLIGAFNTENPKSAEWVPFGTQMALTALLLVGVVYAMRKVAAGLIARAVTLAAFGLLAVLTVRTAVLVTYINYDYAKELLFYAHGAPGVKIALNQLGDLSNRVTGGDALKIGYESDVSWPMTWYMRGFPNARYMGSDLPSDFQNLDAVLIGDYNQKREEMYQKLQPDFTRFDYTQVWWPMQDYMDLTWERIRYSLVNPKARNALWEIIFNRNYKPYAELFNKSALSDYNWQPSHGFTMWIRNDIASRVWDYRTGAATIAGTTGAAAPQAPAPAVTLQAPSGIAVAADGGRYVLDRKTHKLIQFDPQGRITRSLGGFGGQVGQFNDPWGVVVDEQGNILVADTFNHRVQKFDPDGNVIWSVGGPGVTSAPGAGRNTQFFGPRDLVLDRNGNILVTDTGNKRVQVLDANGNFVAQFGSAGTAEGQFDEPVGIAADGQGNIYVADVWNQRIQVFSPEYKYLRGWKVDAWEKMPQNELRAVDNKPFLAFAGDTLYVTSPKTRQVLAYKTNGQPVDLSAVVSFEPGAQPIGLDVQGGTLYVTNGAGGPVMEFPLGGKQ